jgi:hypothetical protein
LKGSLKGKTALITGASGGIGAQVALDLAARGARVQLVARRKERLLSIKNEIEKNGGQAQIFVCDLEDARARTALIRKISGEDTAVDILINNAGFGWYGYFADMPAEVRSSLLNINIDAMLDLTAALLPGMRDRASGHIINIGSIAGGFPNQGIAIYSATKAFMDAFSTSLYREMKGSGVCISVLRLGPVKTEFFDHARQLPHGRPVPAEGFSISVAKASRGVLRLLHNRHRYLYVPSVLGVTRLVALLCGGVIDMLGPLLLNRKMD